MTTNYQKAELLYEKYHREFSTLEKLFFEFDEIPGNIIRDSLKRYLISPITGYSRAWVLTYKTPFKYFLLYAMTMGYFLWQSLIGLKNQKTVKADILFEDWDDTSYKKFYQQVHSYLLDKTIMIFNNSSSNLNTKNYPPNTLHLKRNLQKQYSRHSGWRIFLFWFNKYFVLHQISKSSGINMLFLALSLMKQYARYQTDSSEIQAKFLLSAQDNKYNALMYYLYKRNGIENIGLVQNGVRLGAESPYSGDSYCYCDFYFGFGIRQIEVQPSMSCKYKIPIGSIPLYEGIQSSNISIKPYDIVFVEQISAENTSEIRMDIYLLMIKNLIKFHDKHPYFTISYRIRPGRYMEHVKNIRQEVDHLLDEAGIIRDEGLELSPYESINNAKVVIFYTSTLGLEALGLNKRVLNCIYDVREYAFSTRDEYGVLITRSYEKFEATLLTLLTDKSIEIDEYFYQKKKEFMDLDGDPSLKIANIIRKTIESPKKKSLL